MKKFLCLVSLVLPLALFGCSSSGGLGDGSNDSAADTTSEAGITGVAITGVGLTGEVEGESEADMNSAVAKAVAAKVEEELNAQLESGAFDEDMLAAEEAGDESADATKSFRVGLGSRGITVYMDDEKIPFAGGQMLLDGEIGLRLKFKIGGKIEIVASGQLTSELQNVLRDGFIKDIPYSLSLSGANKLDLNGTFGITVKWFKVSAMSMDLRSSIVDSSVVATGTVADRSVEGTVDMVNVGIRLVNTDILHSPKANSLSCSGSISTKINDNVLGLCDISESCLGCK